MVSEKFKQFVTFYTKNVLPINMMR